jgi:hypothetical protein
MKYDLKISLTLHKILYAFVFMVIIVIVRPVSSRSEIITAVEPNIALLSAIFMADNYYKEYINESIQVFYRYPTKFKCLSLIRRSLFSWCYLLLLAIITYWGFIYVYHPISYTPLSQISMFVNTLIVCTVSTLFMGMLSFTITNFTQNLGIGIGITLLVWGCLNSTISEFLPKCFQLFCLQVTDTQIGILQPYYISRIFYGLVAILLMILNIFALQERPKYKKKGWIMRHGNKN